MKTSSISTIDVRALTDILGLIDGVDLGNLPAFTTLVVLTMNSIYQVTVTERTEVYIQGGALFPESTSVFLDGASLGGTCLRYGWIGVGLPMEIRSAGHRIVTSPVTAIATRPAAGPVAQ